ncbi:MAG: aminotransferase class V-fold PLP-dependent enzyme [Burkholderiaceae bacterium]
MAGLNPAVDPDGLLEYSVVFTDRALNHMSRRFQQVMLDLGSVLRETYRADSVAIVPGGGTYGMEAVARQFGTGQHCLVLRNGWFSFRWSEIFQAGSIPASETVLMARRVNASATAPFAPAPLAEVVDAIRRDRPQVVFAPHVETAAGMILPDDYLRAVADAVHEVGGLFVLDCIASGTVWVDMQALGIDVLISAPQKGWSGPPCAALVMLSARAAQRLGETTSTSYAADLKRWRGIMKAYEDGAHAYHATMPTDALTRVRDAMLETRSFGLERAADAQWELGSRVRALLGEFGYRSVAAEGFQAPGVVVSYTDDPELQSSRRFLALGLQTAAGVPLRCDEPPGFSTFRIGLFGLDKLGDIDRTVANLHQALRVVADERSRRVA